MDRPKISVVVPVYGVEAYIERCAHALLSQTLEALELIFVDDCSPDKSVEIVRRVVREYPARIPHTRLLRHTVNQGVAAARTSGMKIMTGEYMAHCDPDDMPSPDMYARLYEAAKAADADVATCRYLEDPHDGRPHGTAFSGDAYKALSTGDFTYGLWDKIIRTSIIRDNDIYPYPGINYNEDLNVIVRVLCHSRTVIGLEDALYTHSVDRQGSICSGDYRRLLSDHSLPCMKLLDAYLDNLGKESGDRRYSSRLTDTIKFWMKNALFCKEDVEMWCKIWPECRRAIPGIHSLSIKERAIMTLLARSPGILKRILR